MTHANKAKWPFEIYHHSLPFSHHCSHTTVIRVDHGIVGWSSGREWNQTKSPSSKKHTRMLKLQLHFQAAEPLGQRREKEPHKRKKGWEPVLKYSQATQH